MRVINVARDRKTPCVYVGRAWAGRAASPWGNPFRGDGAVEKYRRWIEQRPELIAKLSDELERQGVDALGCWCKRPDRVVSCHADVLAEMIIAYRQTI